MALTPQGPSPGTPRPCLAKASGPVTARALLLARAGSPWLVSQPAMARGGQPLGAGQPRRSGWLVPDFSVS